MYQNQVGTVKLNVWYKKKNLSLRKEQNDGHDIV